MSNEVKKDKSEPQSGFKEVKDCVRKIIKMIKQEREEETERVHDHLETLVVSELFIVLLGPTLT